MSVRIDPVTGLLPAEPVAPVDPSAPPPPAPFEEVFLEGTEPHERTPVDAGVVDAATVLPVGDAGAPVPSEAPPAEPGEAPLVLPVQEAPVDDAGATDDASPPPTAAP